MAARKAMGAAVVLAAGMGTRMKSDLVKVLHPILGRSMLRRVLDALFAAGIDRIVVVVGHQAAKVKASVGGEVEYALQTEQLGTGHAVIQAVPLLAGYKGPLTIAYGDAPLIRPETYADLVRLHAEQGNGATLLSARLADPSGYGRVLRTEDGRDMLGVVEDKDADEAQRAINEINTGTYCFDAEALFAALGEIRPANAQGEYYLPDALALLRQQGRGLGAKVLEDPGEALGINDREQLAQAAQVLKGRALSRLYAAGVSIADPESTFVEPEVQVGRDSIIHPFTSLRGKCRIGEGCSIGPHVSLQQVSMGNDVRIEQTVAEQCEIGAGARVGPFVYLPSGARVEPSERVGPGQTRSDDQ